MHFYCFHINNISFIKLRLFFQSVLNPLNISSIRILETCKNYEDVAKSITIFDACISGEAQIPIADPTNKCGKVLSKLIDAEITVGSDGLDQYIKDTFHVFAQNKREINMMVDFVAKQVKDEELLHNVLCKPEVSEWEYNGTDVVQREPTDLKNLMNPKFVKLFPNLQEISMNINEITNQTNIYTISLIGLLTIIGSTQVNFKRSRDKHLLV